MDNTTGSDNGDDDGSVVVNGGGSIVDAILVSPYLRTIQTAAPTADIFNIPMYIEDGLSESHAPHRKYLASNHERFVYFPQIDPNYNIPLLHVQPTPGHTCRLTGYPCESFAGKLLPTDGTIGIVT